MTTPYLNRIGTAVPAHDVHGAFVTFARGLLEDEKRRTLFDRMAERSGIAHRWSHLRPGLPGGEWVDAAGFYRRSAFPGTAARMAEYEVHAPLLAARAIEALGELGVITHLIVASCTGFTAPGLDQILATRLGLGGSVQRTMVGFMGCYGAVPALRAAYHTVRSDPAARVLVVNVELCSLHMQKTADLETALSFLLFGDAASAALVTAEPAGLALDEFASATIPDSADLITWRIGDQGFDMHLSGKVPARIATSLRSELEEPGPILGTKGVQAIDVWAVHAGGRTVLDAVAQGLRLPGHALDASRAVLQEVGNVSSATLMFVLQRLMREEGSARGLAMAFGPGLCAETFRFRRAA